MHDYIMLHGPAYSGKSTLAHELETNHGYMHIDFGGLLKHLAAQALTSIQSSTVPEYIVTRKEHYRPFLQELGTIIGFQTDTKYIDWTLASWVACGRPNAVFDCVRSPEQALTLQGYGFRLIELHLPQGERMYRAAELGHQYNEAAHNKDIEQTLPQHMIRSQWLDTAYKPSFLAALVVGGRGY